MIGGDEEKGWKCEDSRLEKIQQGSSLSRRAALLLL